MRAPMNDDIEGDIEKLMEISPMQAAFYKEAKPMIPDLEYEQTIGSYRVDFVVRKRRFVIEIDGHDFHKTKEQRTSDCIRQRSLNMDGFHVIRFTGTEVFRDAKKCADQTLELLEQQSEFVGDSAERHAEIYYCHRMQEVIMSIYHKHNRDFYAGDSWIKLEMGPSMVPLSIEKSGNVVTVMHIEFENGDALYDPRVEFALEGEIGGFDRWVPLSITQLANGVYRPCAEIFDVDGDKLIGVTDLDLQKEVAEFCEDWAVAIRLQGWLDANLTENH